MKEWRNIMLKATFFLLLGLMLGVLGFVRFEDQLPDSILNPILRIAFLPDTTPTLEDLLPRETYLYSGETSKPDNLGTEYLIIEKRGEEVIAIRYYPSSGNWSCYKGLIDNNKMTDITTAYVEPGEGPGTGWIVSRIEEGWNPFEKFTLPVKTRGRLPRSLGKVIDFKLCSGAFSNE